MFNYNITHNSIIVIYIIHITIVILYVYEDT